MRLFLHFVCLAFVTAAATSTAWAQTEPALIPRQALFTNPDKEQVMLSPDGKWIGYRAMSDDTMNLWVAPISEPTKAHAVTKQSGAPVVDYRWANLSGRVLYRVPADDGVQVFLLNLESGESRNLTPGKGVTAFIEKLSPDHVEEALLRVKEPAQANFDYRRISLGAGAAEVVFKNERGFERVLFDDDWRPRVAVSRKPEQGYELLQPNGAGEWVSFASFREGAEANASQPIVLDKGGKTLYLTDIAEANPGAQAIWRRLIGDNTTEAGRALLRKVSPFHYAASFAKPVLVAQGGKDQVMPQIQSDRFVAELQKYKKPVTYLLYPDEPHDFRRAENWASLFAIAERFFHDNLGGRYEPIGDDLRGSSLEARAGAELIPGLSLALNQKTSSAPK